MNRKLFKFCTLLLVQLVGITLLADTVDMDDFQGQIGATYRYASSTGGKVGVLEYKFLNYPDFGSAGRESRIVFTAENSADNYSIEMFGINNAIQQINYSNAAGSFTQYYNNGWSLTPRFVKIGESYNSLGTYYYTTQGIIVTGSIDAAVTITGIESVTTPKGSFESIKVTADVLTTETWNSGWLQTNQSQTVWYAREVGMVKQVISTTQSSSTGQQGNSNTTNVLNFTSIGLPNEQVIPLAKWGKFVIENSHVDTGGWMGYLEVSKSPWVYSYNEGHYFYIPESTANEGRGWLYSP